MAEQHPDLPRKTTDSGGNDSEKVYEAEVIHEDYHQSTSTSYGSSRQDSRGFQANVWSWSSMRGGLGGFDTASRYAPAVTFFLLVVVLFRFGFLAGLGFLFFYLIGSAFSTVQLIRRMAEGKSANPWPWRIGNWAVSFLLAGWLSGGFQ